MDEKPLYVQVNPTIFFLRLEKLKDGEEAAQQECCSLGNQRVYPAVCVEKSQNALTEIS
jgi:hypothetical protein